MLLSHPLRRSNHRALVSLIEPTGTSPAALDAAVTRSLSFEELYQEVRQVAHALRSLGIKPGDRVATYSPSNAEAVILCLGTLAVGGVWSSCPAEFGVKSTLERLEQIEPKILLSADFYKYNGKKLAVFPNLIEILKKLPSVRHDVVVGQLEKDREPREAFPREKDGREWLTWNQLMKKGMGAPEEIQFHRGSSMNPVWGRSFFFSSPPVSIFQLTLSFQSSIRPVRLASPRLLCIPWAE
jgi:acetoacetyl-CoA synthetase